jgi:hypothetical protein
MRLRAVKLRGLQSSRLYFTELQRMSEICSGRQWQLLAKAGSINPAPVDAIIVPTARPAQYLRTAIGLAKLQRCPLVVLCSRLASAEATVRMAALMDIDVVALDVAALPPGLLPPFRTSAVLRGTRFDMSVDTSMKRNLGLLLAQAIGWERIVFLDDDITVPDAEDLNSAAGLTHRYAGVGLSIGGFPDNSVVCHAYRDAGGRQDSFIGGGALAVGRQSFTSFFPGIYNEDWFFLLNETGLRPSAVTGRAIQASYDPYRETRRARSEELGDSLAEGLFSLLDNGRRLTDANTRFWTAFLGRRRSFIDDIIAMADAALPDGADKNRLMASLKAAKGRNCLISPELCVGYMEAWRVDRKLWEQHIQMRQPSNIQKLLADLALMHCYRAAA